MNTNWTTFTASQKPNDGERIKFKQYPDSVEIEGTFSESTWRVTDDNSNELAVVLGQSQFIIIDDLDPQ